MAKTVSAGFVELLGRLALTDDQEATASTRATTIKDFFDANFAMSERAFTIGSYRRGPGPHERGQRLSQLGQLPR